MFYLLKSIQYGWFEFLEESKYMSNMELMIDYLILSRFAEVSEGLLNIIGGGVGTYWFKEESEVELTLTINLALAPKLEIFGESEGLGSLQVQLEEVGVGEIEKGDNSVSLTPYPAELIHMPLLHKFSFIVSNESHYRITVKTDDDIKFYNFYTKKIKA